MQAAASKRSPCCLGTALKKTNGGDGCKCLLPWCRTEISPSYLEKKAKRVSVRMPAKNPTPF